MKKEEEPEVDLLSIKQEDPLSLTEDGCEEDSVTVAKVKIEDDQITIKEEVNEEDYTGEDLNYEEHSVKMEGLEDEITVKEEPLT